MEFAFGIVVFVVGLLASIALHEVGHMVPAKKFGVRVSQYMVGFGPTIWSKTKGETEYGFKWIPLGGYVRLIGMYPPSRAVGNPPARTWLGRLAADARDASAEEIREGEDHRAFYRLSTPKKLVVMLGGPVMNLVIALVLMATVMVGFGIPAASTTLDTVSACVIPASAPVDRGCEPGDQPAPGAAAGLLPGDKVLSFDGTRIDEWSALTPLIRAAGGESTPIVVERDGQELTLTVTPVVADRPVLDENGEAKLDAAGDPVTEPVGFLGVTSRWLRDRAPIGDVPRMVADQTWQTMGVVATLPARVGDIASTTFGGGERGTDSVVGPVGIGRFAGEIASSDLDLGDKAVSILLLLASLNIALFVFNLIPLPPLDGGHVAAALWEGGRRQVARLRGRPRPGPFDSAKLVPVAYTVFILLGGVGLMLLYADIVNPVTI